MFLKLVLSRPPTGRERGPGEEGSLRSHPEHPPPPPLEGGLAALLGGFFQFFDGRRQQGQAPFLDELQGLVPSA